MARPIQRTRTRRSRVGVGVLALVMGASLLPLTSVAAAEPQDVVLDWNLNAVQVLSNLATGTPPGAGLAPGPAAIHLAMVQGAIYDAVNAIDGGHAPYLSGLPSAPSTASKGAAAAKAAHDVLVGVLPQVVPALPATLITTIDANLDVLYDASITEILNAGVPQADINAGVTIGAATATRMLAARVGDGRFVFAQFSPGTGIGQWRVEPPTGNDPNAWVFNVTPFTLASPDQFATDGPYAIDSNLYLKDFNEVKSMGGSVLTGSNRTDAQTQEALFYSINPFPMENAALRDVATARGLSNTQSARLLAMSSFSAADGLIGCWVDKHAWSFWRPITAIREAANDGNDKTQPYSGPNTAGWLPLLTTPPYPDQPSGYNCFTAAMMNAAKRYFDSNEATFTLRNVNGARTYDTFTSVLKDTIDARVWLGIHFRKADVDGAGLGENVAKWVSKNFFQPVP